MTDETKPALTPEEWREVDILRGPRKYELCVGEDDGKCAYLIALNNAALPDSDPRKITRNRLTGLRRAVEIAQLYVEDASDAETIGTLVAALTDAQGIAAALESYLPPNNQAT